MKFTYKAIKDGKVVKGKIVADSETKVADFLKSQNYTIIRINSSFSYVRDFLARFFDKLGFSDVVAFTRQLAIMLNAGLTIAESLQIFKKQSIRPSQTTLMRSLDEDIRSGNSLSFALKKHDKLFNNLYISLVKAGEASGKLDSILSKLSDHLEKERLFHSKVKGALVYPAIIVVGMIIVLFIMITFVIPKLLLLYKDLNVDLPGTTKFLILISNFFQAFWVQMIISVTVGIFLLLEFLKTPSGKRSFDSLLFKIPKVSQVIKISTLVNTTRTLGILIGAGVSIVDGLTIVKDTSSNTLYREAFSEIIVKIEKGESLGRALDEAALFPPILVQMVEVGEETGHLDETMLRLSDYFESESELVTKSLVTLIEPTVIMVLGVAVGFIVISVITPIFSIANNIQ